MSHHTPAHGPHDGRLVEHKPLAPPGPTLSRASRQGHTCASACAAVAMLEQAAAFIRAIDDSSYAAPSQVLKGGTIGKHFRHVVDHFAAALAPLRSADAEVATIDYDHRERNVPMETSREAAVSEIRGVVDDLSRVCEQWSARPVRVRLMLSADGLEREYDSTLGREIAFASHHAVHHHAMIEAIAGELGVPAPEGFGKAPSTISYERSASGGGAR